MFAFDYGVLYDYPNRRVFLPMIHTPTYALATHLITANPRHPKPPTQTEQFVDAPPKDVYVSEWRKRVKQKQEAKEKKHNGK